MSEAFSVKHKVVPVESVVLDIEALPVRPKSAALSVLRLWQAKASEQGYRVDANVLGAIADQIEAQTKPPRIPEPGKWGVVRAKGQGLAEVEWVNEGKFWVSMGGDPHCRWAEWANLKDPVLVREGVAS